MTTIRNSTQEEYILEEQEEADSHESHDDPPQEKRVSRKRPTWLRDTLQEGEGHSSPSGSYRDKKIPPKFSSYSALMCHIIDSKPSSFDEANELQVWKYAMMEEYQSIMKNDVW